MMRSVHALLLGLTTLLGVLSPLQNSWADLYQFAYSGQVTSIDNPYGFFTSPALLGAPVNGFFTYTDSPNAGSDPFSPFVTFYLHDRPSSPITELSLNIGGAEARSSLFSLTNMAVGNDNPDSLPPFFPAGDFFRYVDELDEGNSLFDFSSSSLQQFPFGNIVLADSTGNAFTSQGLPHGLPLAAFDQRFGFVLIADENGDITGWLEFQIDSIQAIPEPSMLALMLIGLSVTTCIARRRRLEHRPVAAVAELGNLNPTRCTPGPYGDVPIS